MMPISSSWTNKPSNRYREKVCKMSNAFNTWQKHGTHALQRCTFFQSNEECKIDRGNPRSTVICSEGATIFHPVRTGSPGVD